MLAKPVSLKLARARKRTIVFRQKSEAQRLAARAHAEAYDHLRRDVYARDHGRCRVCGKALKLYGALLEMMHLHHIVYRSAGGQDTASNTISLCATDHDREHRHLLSITGTADQLSIIDHDPHSA